MHYSREIVVEPRTEQDLYENLPNEGDETELVLARVHRKDGTVAPARGAELRRPTARTCAGRSCKRATSSRSRCGRGRRARWAAAATRRSGSSTTSAPPTRTPSSTTRSSSTRPTARRSPSTCSAASPDRVDRASKDGRIGHALRVGPTRRHAGRAARAEADRGPSRSSSAPPSRAGPTSASGTAPPCRASPSPTTRCAALAAELTAGQDDARREAPGHLRLRRRRHPLRELRLGRVVAAEPPAGAARAPAGRLRRQGDAAHHAAQGRRHPRERGAGADALHGRSPRSSAHEHAAIPLFDHGIAYLPGENGKPGIWLDATSPESRLGPLPSMDARTVAFSIDEGPAKVVDTPASSPDEHGVDARVDHQALAVRRRRSHRRGAPLRRRRLRAAHEPEAARRPRAVGRAVPRVRAGSRPCRSTATSRSRPDLAARASPSSSTARTPRASRGARATSSPCPLAEATTLTSQLAPLVHRTLPVVLPPRVAPGHQTRTITIVAPARLHLLGAAAERRGERRRVRQGASSSSSARSARTR